MTDYGKKKHRCEAVFASRSIGSASKSPTSCARPYFKRKWFPNENEENGNDSTCYAELLACPCAGLSTSSSQKFCYSNHGSLGRNAGAWTGTGAGIGRSLL